MQYGKAVYMRLLFPVSMGSLVLLHLFDGVGTADKTSLMKKAGLVEKQRGRKWKGYVHDERR